MAKRSGLGMGLGALFDDNSSLVSETAATVRMSQIEPNRAQPRQTFDEDKLRALADSISRNGLLQPIIVRAAGDGQYKIIAGERRFRACRMLGFTEIPAIVRDFSDQASAEAALIENIVREDLNPVEEARGLRELMDVYGLTQEVLAKAVGRSRSSIANSVRLLSLSHEILTMLENGSLTVGQAKVLAGIDDTDTAVLFARRAASDGMTVRELERAVNTLTTDSQKPPKAPPKRNILFTETALSLCEMLDRKIVITPGKKDGKGKLTIDFDSEDDLKKIAETLAKMKD
jgi:ParB family chromosome partitioning protein